MAYIGRTAGTLRVGGAIPDDALREAIDTSYDLVVATLPKSEAPDRPDGARRGPSPLSRCSAAPPRRR